MVNDIDGDALDELMEGKNTRNVVCEKQEVFFTCFAPAEETVGKCIGYDLTSVLTIAKSLSNHFCELRLDEWLDSPSKYACLERKSDDIQTCASSFESSFAGKGEAQIASTVVDILTTGEHCDELKFTKKCFNKVIEGCTYDEKKISKILIDDLTSASGCAGLSNTQNSDSDEED